MTKDNTNAPPSDKAEHMELLDAAELFGAAREEAADNFLTSNVSAQSEDASRPNLALVVFYGGKAMAVAYRANASVRQFIEDSGGGTDTFDLESCGVDLGVDLGPFSLSGVLVCEMKLVDDGPGDYPDTREVVLSITSGRVATPEEWKAFREGDLPWEA